MAKISDKRLLEIEQRYTDIQLKDMMKLVPNNMVFDIEDLVEIFKNEI